MGLLSRVMRQWRTVATAMGYIGALSRGTRASCQELALRAGHLPAARHLTRDDWKEVTACNHHTPNRKPR
jgi:hypothetical protein